MVCPRSMKFKHRAVLLGVAVAAVLLYLVSLKGNKKSGARDRLHIKSNAADFEKLEEARRADAKAVVGEHKHEVGNLKEFNLMLLTWPRKKPRAAIYYLVDGEDATELGNLVTSVRSLEDNFNKHYEYPIIIYHEHQFPDHVASALRELASNKVFFQQVTFRAPPYLDDLKQFDVDRCPGHDMAFRHRTYFRAKLAYEEPLLNRLEYYWWLSSDTFINQPVKYDVFDFMRSNNLRYGFNKVSMESPTCVLGLWSVAAQYINQYGVKPHFFKLLPDGQTYISNMEISSTKPWLSRDYQYFIDYVDSLGGVYYYKWGDGPIKSIALSLFLPKSEMHHFKDISFETTGIRHSSL